MTPRAGRLPRRNPFATRYVRPGALPFLFPPGHDLAGLVERLRRQGWWGQVVGPHGTGKSTLLAALVPELERAGRRPLLVCLHEGERALPAGARSALNEAPRLFVIDGHEQLGWWARRGLHRACRRNGHGLLITTHHSAGLPELYRTTVTADLARRVVDKLLGGAEGSLLDKVDVAALLAARRGNLRAVLFDLYDEHERHQGEPGECSSPDG
jgi:hypothetical protein